jgi:hypothetical protein
MNDAYADIGITVIMPTLGLCRVSGFSARHSVVDPWHWL